MAAEMQFPLAVTAHLTATRRLVERQEIKLRDQAELVDRLFSARDQARVTISELMESEARSRALTYRASLILVIFGVLIVAAASAGATWWFVR
jgi:hypothetical protein